jgi:hypothetical protein
VSAILAAVLLAAGCGTKTANETAGPAPEGASRLIVTNRSLADMDIYLIKAGSRIRLGMAPANQTTDFPLMAGQLAGVGAIHFEAVPLGGLGRRVISEPVHISPGSAATFDISPQ